MYCTLCNRSELHVTRVEQLRPGSYYDEKRFYHCDNCLTEYTVRWRTVCDACGSTANKLTHRGYNYNGSPRLLCRQCEDSV